MKDLGDLGIIVNPTGRTEQRVPCPRCSDRERDDVLGVNIESGTYHCFRCGWKGRAGGHNTDSRLITRIDDPAVAERKRARLRQTWKQTVRLESSAATAIRRYLESRALGEILTNPPTALRAHPALEYWDGAKCLGKFPALVAVFASRLGQPITLHVTYLRSDGFSKAPVPSAKKILGVPVRGATKGGAIQLYPPRGGVLGVAEGIETALSLHLIAKIPTWAAFCADNLARLELPQDVRRLYIGVDKDPTGKGEAVAAELATRMHSARRSVECFLVLPDLEGPADLNDELMRRRAS